MKIKVNIFQVTYYDLLQCIMVTKSMSTKEVINQLENKYTQILSVTPFVEEDTEDG